MHRSLDYVMAETTVLLWSPRPRLTVEDVKGSPECNREDPPQEETKIHNTKSVVYKIFQVAPFHR